jgi:hypothetical protein
MSNVNGLYFGEWSAVSHERFLSLAPYRQCSASMNVRLALLVVRSAVDTAICSKPLARWMYGDWMPPAES